MESKRPNFTATAESVSTSTHKIRPPIITQDIIAIACDSSSFVTLKRAFDTYRFSRDNDDKTLLHHFVSNTYCESSTGKNLIKSCPKQIIAKDEQRLTALMIAAGNGISVDIVKLLIEQEKSYLKANEKEHSLSAFQNNLTKALYISIVKGKQQNTELLLKELSQLGLTENALKKIFEDALYLAAEAEDATGLQEEIVAALLEQGPPITVISSVLKKTIRSMISRDKLTVLQSFLSRFVNQEIKNELIQIALFEAAQHGNLKMLLNTLIQSLPTNSHFKDYGITQRLLTLFDDAQTIYLTNLVFTAEKTLGAETVLSILSSAEKQKQTPQSLTDSIINYFSPAEQPAQNPDNLIKEVNKLIQLKRCEKNSKKTKEIKEVKSENHISDEKFIQIRLKASEKNNQANLSNLIERFKQQKFPLDSTILTSIHEKYSKILKKEKQFILLSQSELHNRQKKCVAQIKKNGINDPACIELLAIIREQAIRLSGNIPYSTQMFNMLAMLHYPVGCFAQIKPSEGKSLIIAMLAAFKALIYDQNVSIVTSSPDLAERDARDYTPFFASLGLTSLSYNEINKIEAGRIKNANIVYGTTGNFMEHAINASLGDIPECREWDCVIADEADSHFYDDNTDFQISIRNPYFIEEIIQIFWSYRENVAEIPNRIRELGYLNFPKDLLAQYLKSLKMAESLIEGKNYKIIDNKIHIVNYQHNGEVFAKNVQWGKMVRSFLTLKHNLPIAVDTNTQAHMASQDFFKGFKSIYGVSATLGNAEERKKLDALGKKIPHYDSPTHFVSQRKELPPIIAQDEKEQKSILINTIKSMKTEGRPVLIICQTIKETEELRKVLAEEKMQDQVYVYNAVQTQSVESILRNAGKEESATLATNIAGRGTHIEISPEALAKGGLHVILTSLAINERVEEQNFSRGARKGQPGSCQYILTKQNLLDHGINTSESKEISIELEKKRKEEATFIVSRDSFNNFFNSLMLAAQKIFFALPKNIKKQYNELWIQCFEDIENIVEKYARLFSSSDETSLIQYKKQAEREVGKRMLAFWEGNNIGAHVDPKNNLSLFEAAKKVSHKLFSILTEHFSNEDQKPTSQKRLNHPKLFITDVDKTLYPIHTGGILIGQPSVSYFKNPTLLKEFFYKLKDEKVISAIATYATEIELVSGDGTIHPPLFLSGKAAIEAQFSALLGNGWKDIIKSIQAFEINNRTLTKKVRYQISNNQYINLQSIIEEKIKEIATWQNEITILREFKANKNREKILHTQIQDAYNEIHALLHSFNIIDQEEVKAERPYGKIPHIENILQEVKFSEPDRSGVVFSDDTIENNVSANLIGCTTIENVSENDELRWLEQILPQKQLRSTTSHLATLLGGPVLIESVLTEPVQTHSTGPTIPPTSNQNLASTTADHSLIQNASTINSSLI